MTRQNPRIEWTTFPHRAIAFVRRARTGFALVLALPSVALLPAGSTQAATRTWDNGNANFLWGDEVNWDGDSPGNEIPGTNDVAVFSSIGIGGVDLGEETRTINRLQVSAAGYTFSNGTLDLRVINPHNNGLTTIAANVTDAAGNGLLINQHNGDSTGLLVSGRISIASTAAGALSTGSPNSKNGTFTLGSASQTNTVAGGVLLVTQINGGTVFQGPWIIGGGLNLTRSSSQYNSGARLNGPIFMGGNLVNSVGFNSGGVIELNHPGIGIGGDLLVQPTSTGQSPGIKINQPLAALDGDVKVYGATLWINVTDPIPSTQKTFLLGDTAAGVRDATIQLAANGKTLNNPIAVQSGSSYQAIVSSGANGTGEGNKVTYAGAITLNKAVRIDAYNGANCILDVTGVIGGAHPVTINAGGQAGDARLSAENTYSGNTLIGFGTLQLANNLALQNSALDTSGAGLLVFMPGIDTPTFGGIVGPNNLTLPANVKSLTLNPGAGITHTYSGALRSSPGFTALIKTGLGTQAFSGANTYGGETAIHAGTLKIESAGSIGGSSRVSIAAGATFDVSAVLPTYVLAASLAAGGTGTEAGLSAAVIRGTPGGTIDLGSRSVHLTFTPTAFNGDTGHPALLIFRGTLALNGNAITVDNASGTRLGPGTYRLIEVSDGVIDATSIPTVNMSEDQLADYAKVSIAIDGGHVNLVVDVDPRQPLFWATGDGIWDIETTTNWVNAIDTPDAYREGDAVILEDTHSSGAAIGITLNSRVDPWRVNVANSTRAYALSGSGGIGGTAGLSKSGANALTLNNANTYSGKTAIHGGTLALDADGSIDHSSQIWIAAGATFDVSAIAQYALSESNTLSAAGTGVTALAAAVMRGDESIDFGSRPVSLTFTPLDVAGDTNCPALVVSQGAAIFDNNVIDIVNAGAAPLGAGIYRLIQVNGGVINGAPSVVVTVSGTGLAPDLSSYLVVDAGNVNLIVTAKNDQPLTWATGDGVWDIVTTANWIDRTNGVVRFFEADQVVFEDTKSGASPIAVNIGATVNPESVVVNAAKDYTFSGSGGIGGATGLTKSGNGALTLAGANTFYGGVTLSAGTLNIDHELALGTDNFLTLNGGTLTIDSAVVHGLDALIINGNATVGSTTGPKSLAPAVDWLGGTSLSVIEDMNFGNAAIFLGSGSRGLNIAAGKTLALGGVASGTGFFRVDCAIPSGVLILTGANTFSTAVDIRNGILSVSSINANGVAGPLGTSSAPVTMGYAYNPAHATLRYTGSGETTDRAIRLDNNNANAVLVLDHAGTGLLKFTSSFTFRQSQTRTLALKGEAGSTGELAGALGENGTTALLKDGDGVWILSAANTYRGGTTVSKGTLKLGASGSIANSPTIVIAAGAVFSVTEKAVYTMSGTQTNIFNIEPSGSGSSGRIDAGALDIGSGRVVLNAQGMLNDRVYVLATYTPPLAGAPFASVTGLPDRYSIDYAYNGNKIAVVRESSGLTLIVR